LNQNADALTGTLASPKDPGLHIVARETVQTISSRRRL